MRTNILDVAAQLLENHEIRGFILPANSGTTALAFLDRFGTGYQYIAVGNPATSHEKGYVHHSGMTEETKERLQRLGFEVVLQEVSAFQPMNASPAFAEHAKRMQSSYEQGIHSPNIRIEGTTLSWVVECTIRALFDEQVKTCVEICLMAGESDKTDHRTKYIAICTPSRWSSGFRDCAVVLEPSTPATFFQNPPRIYEIAYSETPRDSRKPPERGK
jgi:hypothetical protein